MAYRETEHTRQKKANTRIKLLEAARNIVAEGGFSAATAAAVAHNSGVATGSIYRHFENKSELVAEVFRYATEYEVNQVFQASDVQNASDTAAERLRRAVTVFARRALQGSRLAYALIAEPVDPRVEQERLKYRFAYAEIFEDLIRAGMSQGLFIRQDATLSAAALVGLLSEAMIGPLTEVLRNSTAKISTSESSSRRLHADQLIEELCDLSLRVVGYSVSTGHNE